jgi:hypothetical protein
MIAVLITALSIAGYAFASGGVMFSPGSLNAVQGRLLGGVTSHAEINGNCNACHVAPWEAEAMGDRCSVCHANVAAEMKDPESVHGRMMQIDLDAQCRDCHPEHNGPQAPLTVLEGWKFPHLVVGYSLDGHQFTAGKEPFLCSDCHRNDVMTFDQVTCRECHSQMDITFMIDHVVTFGETCLNCHDGGDKFGNDFNHNVFAFSLTGKHAAIACSKCHMAEHTLAALQATPRGCFSCHESDDPHEGGLGTDCASCHTAVGWKPARFDHNRAAFKLIGAHVNVTCENCHVNGVYKGTPMDCFSCHKQNDSHNGQLGNDCAKCHSPTDWKAVSFDHSTSAFPLVGKHLGVNCASCHKNGVYKGTPQDCFACHAADDAHKGQFGTDCARCHNPGSWQAVSFDHSKTALPLTGLHANVLCKACHVNGVFKGTPKDCFSCHAAKDIHNGQFGTICSTCHNTSGWKSVSFDHSKSAFPLAGAHTTVACKSCHVNNVYRGTPKDCYSCHAAQDAHNGQFGTNCGSCHKPTKWSDVTFDHNNTAFPLDGLHTNVACKSCHVNNVYTGTPKDCYSCHAARDAHSGQFGTVCSACHNTSGWKNATFNHNNTAFPLAGTHANLNCKSCHVNNVYQGTPRDCYSCHAARDAHNGQFGTDCASCHRPTQWQEASFNHNNTAFPLTGNHSTVACQSCHVNGQYNGTPTDCYSCHAAQDAHGGQFGTNCGACHNPSSWKNATFDHNNTSFPLIGKHTNLECQKCHGNGVYQGTPTQCSACHEDKHNGENGPDCGACHTPTDWGSVNMREGKLNFLMWMEVRQYRD